MHNTTAYCCYMGCTVMQHEKMQYTCVIFPIYDSADILIKTQIMVMAEASTRVQRIPCTHQKWRSWVVIIEIAPFSTLIRSCWHGT